MKAKRLRICATIPHAQGLKHWGPLHEEMIAEIAHEGLEVVMVDLPDVFVTSVSSRHDADIVAAAHTEAALRAEKEGFDAVAMGCLFEPGVAAARGMLRIPVIGEAEAAMHLASLGGRRFSFVGPNSEENSVLFEHAWRYGFSDHLTSVRGVKATSLSFATEQKGLVKLMVSEARLAIEEEGAQAIIGYGSLTLIKELRKALPVPVINSVMAGILVAEMVVRAQSS